MWRQPGNWRLFRAALSPNSLRTISQTVMLTQTQFRDLLERARARAGTSLSRHIPGEAGWMHDLWPIYLWPWAPVGSATQAHLKHMWHHTTLEHVDKTTISFTYLSRYQQVGRWKTCCKVLLWKIKDWLTSKASLESPIKRFRSRLTSRLRLETNPGFLPRVPHAKVSNAVVGGLRRAWPKAAPIVSKGVFGARQWREEQRVIGGCGAREGGVVHNDAAAAELTSDRLSAYFGLFHFFPSNHETLQRFQALLVAKAQFVYIIRNKQPPPPKKNFICTWAAMRLHRLRTAKYFCLWTLFSICPW